MKRKALFILQKALMPRFAVSLYYYWKYRARVSSNCEIDLTNNVLLGRDCVIGPFSKIKAMNGVLQIGDHARISTGCFIAANTGRTVIGSHFECGPKVNIICSSYVHTRKDQHLEDQGTVSKGIIIGDNVKIGPGCTVTDGAVIGNNTTIAPNSVVNRKYPANVFLQGVPAKIVSE